MGLRGAAPVAGGAGPDVGTRKPVPVPVPVMVPVPTVPVVPAVPVPAERVTGVRNVRAMGGRQRAAAKRDRRSVRSGEMRWRPLPLLTGS